MATQADDHLLHQRGDAREDGRAEDQELAVAQERGAAGEGLRDRGLVRVEVLVDWRADDHDHVLGGADDGRVGRGGQPAGRHRALKQRCGPGLVERQLGRVHALDRVLAHVVDGHPGTPVRESDRQRQAHVPTTADDHNVPLELAVGRRCRHACVPSVCLVGTS